MTPDVLHWQPGWTAATLRTAEDRMRRRNRRWLAFLLIYTIFNGAVRKWIIQGGVYSNVLLLIQILLPWVFYFAAAGSKRRYGPLLLSFGGILLLMAFNPLNQTLYHGLFGILLHLGFLLIAFHYLENRHLYPWKDLHGLLIAIFLLEIGLSIVQYSLPRTHFLNRYAAEGAVNIAFVGEAARVTGTYSFVSGFTSWLFFINLWLLSLSREKTYRAGTILILLGLTIFASIISGSRGALIFSVVFTLLSLRELFKGRSGKTITVLLILFGGMAVGFFQKNEFLQQAWANFYSRIEDGVRDKEYGRRTFGIFDEVLNFRGEHAWLGNGLGATYQGARQVWGESYFLLHYGGYEEEPERIILEGGFLLFFLRSALILYFLFRLNIPLAAKLFLYLIIIFFTHSIFNIYNIVFVTLGICMYDGGYFQQKKASAT